MFTLLKRNCICCKILVILIDNYKTILRHAKSIITPYRYNIKALEATCDGAVPVHYAKWGFHESMIRQNIHRNRSFKHDALFLA